MIPAPVVRLEQVTKIYEAGEIQVHAIRGASLVIERGEFVAIIGASGSGKSTMMNILGCLDRPTTGHYFLDGADVARLSRVSLARLRNEQLGFVFQNYSLLGRTTALENVELPMFYNGTLLSRREQRERARAALERVGLGKRADHYPSQLSGGEQQRVTLARALVNEPKLLLADEPTGNLDSKTSIEVMAVFQALNDSGITIVIVTHEANMAAYCKRILTLQDGLVVDERNGRELSAVAFPNPEMAVSA